MLASPRTRLVLRFVCVGQHNINMQLTYTYYAKQTRFYNNYDNEVNTVEW